LIGAFACCNQHDYDLAGKHKAENVNPSKVNAITLKQDQIASTTDSLVWEIESKQPGLQIRFYVNKNQNKLDSINIFSGDVTMQHISAKKEIWSTEFKLVDWNFDGFQDITVLYNRGSGGASYWIWNYNVKTGKYDYNQELSEKIGLEIDNQSKYIVFHYRAGYAEENWDTMTYRNNKLNFVKGCFQERWNSQDGKRWIKFTRKKSINNILITTMDSIEEK
jgi:hypothetical protein